MPIIDILREKSEKFDEALARANKKLTQSGGLESGRAATGVDDVTEALRKGTADELPGGGLEICSAMEAIILEDLRPAYMIENDQINIHGDYDRIDLIRANKAMLEGVSKNVGRVDLLNHATMEYVGTGWLIAKDIVVTNRHVANIFPNLAGRGDGISQRARLGAHCGSNWISSAKNRNQPNCNALRKSAKSCSWHRKEGLTWHSLRLCRIMICSLSNFCLAQSEVIDQWQR